MKAIIFIFLILGLMSVVSANGQTSTPPDSSQTETKKLETDKPVKIKKDAA